VGADFLGGITPTLRLGAGLLWVPSLKAKAGDTEAKAGSQVNLRIGWRRAGPLEVDDAPAPGVTRTLNTKF
jgi:hypothetical protein